MAPEVYCNAYFGVTVVVRRQRRCFDGFPKEAQLEAIELLSKGGFVRQDYSAVVIM